MRCSWRGVASVVRLELCGYTSDLDRVSRFMRQGLHFGCMFRGVKSESGSIRGVSTNVMKQGNDFGLSMNGIWFVV